MFQIIPEWAPNIHPMIVHFPIGLLVVAVLLDVFQWVKPLRNRLDSAALLLYFFGVIGAAGAVWSGRVAADSVRVTTEAQTVLSDHDDRAIVALIFFAAFFVVRLLIWAVRLDRKGLFRLVVPIVGIAGLVLLWQTAELGKELVYKHGVGVAAVVFEDGEIEYTGESRWDNRDDGWLWHAGHGAANVFQERSEPHGERTEERLHLHTREDDEGIYMEIAAKEGEGPLFLIVPGALQDISLEMLVNTEDFEGRIGLAHHFHGSGHYEFLDFDGETVRLGRHEAGEDEILDEGHAHAHGWFSLRVVADGRHFHAYVDEEMIAHGHATPWERGDVGLLLHGAGSVAIRSLHLVELREAPANDYDHGADDEHGPDHDEGNEIDDSDGHDHVH